MTSIRPELKFQDIAEERGFYRRYQNLPKALSNTIRIADREDFYSVVGEDALFVAENVYHTTSVLKTTTALQQDEPLKYVTMSKQVCYNFLKMCLFDYGYKVEIYDKTWKLIKNASPGNIEQVDDLLTISINDSVVLCSIKFVNNDGQGNCTLGCAFVDSSTYKIGMLEIIDNEVYSNLESLIIQLGVKECLVPDLRDNVNSKRELQKISRVIDRCGCVVTYTKPGDFQPKDVEHDVIKLIGDELSMALPKFSKNSLGACNALLDYLNVLRDTSNYGKYQLVEHSLSQFMKLDASALNALNIFPQSGSQITAPTFSHNVPGDSAHGNKVNSLFQLLNKCKTNSGIRLLNEWLKQPLLDIDELNKRHDLVEYLIDQLELRQILRNDFLPKVPDMRRITRMLMKKKDDLEDVLKIYTFATTIPKIISNIEIFLNEDDMTSASDSKVRQLVETHWLNPLKTQIQPLDTFQELVEQTVDLDSYNEHNEFMIRMDVDETLANTKALLDELKAKIRDIHYEAADDLNFDPEKKLKLEVHHIHGYCMRLTRNDAKAIRNNRKYMELSTVKAGIFFTTKELKQLAQEVGNIQKDYDRLQADLVREIVKVTLTYVPVLETLSMTLSHMDVLCSFAHVASYAPIPYVRPKMFARNSRDGEKRKLILKESRHPVLEAQEDISFISNDVCMKRDERDFIIITGPNMGGKSTYIRQIGVITLMAQIGCFVPCDEAEISIMDSILCRVGAGDSQFKGVSTFMMEMLETSSILKNATENSLVIVDELGRGTSTYDGFGLAWSISEYIASKIKCFTLFATHFHELTNLSNKLPNVVNMQVLAHIDENEQNVSAGKEEPSDEITLLYKVADGISDQSFGINVAEVCKFPSKIVKMAKRKASELEEMKEIGQAVKKRCDAKDISVGTEKLKSILQDWVKQAEDQNLLLQREQGIDKIAGLLKDIYEESTKDKFIEEIISDLK
ncbi:hypothetical protein ACO0QE_000316 [Hanseniaspora vineae]